MQQVQKEQERLQQQIQEQEQRQQQQAAEQQRKQQEAQLQQQEEEKLQRLQQQAGLQRQQQVHQHQLQQQNVAFSVATVVNPSAFNPLSVGSKISSEAEHLRQQQLAEQRIRMLEGGDKDASATMMVTATDTSEMVVAVPIKCQQSNRSPEEEQQYKQMCLRFNQLKEEEERLISSGSLPSSLRV